MPRRTLTTGLTAVAMVAIVSLTATAAPVAADPTTWTVANQPYTGSESAANGYWVRTTTMAGQLLNGRPTFLASPDDADGQKITATVATTNVDDDFFGFALGFSTDPSDPATDYLLIDWKKADQMVDWGEGVGPVNGSSGLAVSHVTGVPNLTELWSHTDDAFTPAGAVVELARAANLGSTGWVGSEMYAFSIEYTTSSLDVWVDGVLEISIEGSFPAGPIALYDFSQPSVGFSAITMEALNAPPEVSGSGAEDVSVFEGENGTTSGSFTDPDGDPLTITCAGTCAGFSDDGAGVWSWSQPLPEGPHSETVTITANDGEFEVADTFDVTVTNLAPVITATSSLPGTLADDTELSVSADFTDPGVLDTHVAIFAWGDGTSSAGTISEIDGAGTAVADHHYASPGFYTVSVTVWDDDGASDTASLGQVFVFDPDDFVTGGGWISSPEGAVLDAPDHRGKTTFGFVARYGRDGSVRGNLQIQVHKELRFHATRFDSLLILDGVAHFSGEGEVNGEPGYSFEVIATDERLAASTRDLFWVEISGPGGLVYGGAAYPTGLAIVGKGIQVHDQD